MSFEPMSAAGLRRELEQANTNLFHHLEARKHHTEEIERWQAIVKNLDESIEMMESPASAVRKKAAAPEPAKQNHSGPRIRWDKQWPVVLGELSVRNIFPTKRSLIVEIQARFQLTDATANAAVNMAIRKGTLVLRQDRCYLPTNSLASAAS